MTPFAVKKWAPHPRAELSLVLSPSSGWGRSPGGGGDGERGGGRPQGIALFPPGDRGEEGASEVVAAGEEGPLCPPKSPDEDHNMSAEGPQGILTIEEEVVVVDSEEMEMEVVMEETCQVVVVDEEANEETGEGREKGQVAIVEDVKASGEWEVEEEEMAAVRGGAVQGGTGVASCGSLGDRDGLSWARGSGADEKATGTQDTEVTAPSTPGGGSLADTEVLETPPGAADRAPPEVPRAAETGRASAWRILEGREGGGSSLEGAGRGGGGEPPSTSSSSEGVEAQSRELPPEPVAPQVELCGGPAGAGAHQPEAAEAAAPSGAVLDDVVGADVEPAEDVAAPVGSGSSLWSGSEPADPLGGCWPYYCGGGLDTSDSSGGDNRGGGTAGGGDERDLPVGGFGAENPLHVDEQGVAPRMMSEALVIPETPAEVPETPMEEQLCGGHPPRFQHFDEPRGVDGGDIGVARRPYEAIRWQPDLRREGAGAALGVPETPEEIVPETPADEQIPRYHQLPLFEWTAPGSAHRTGKSVQWAPGTSSPRRRASASGLGSNFLPGSSGIRGHGCRTAAIGGATAEAAFSEAFGALRPRRLSLSSAGPPGAVSSFQAPPESSPADGAAASHGSVPPANGTEETTDGAGRCFVPRLRPPTRGELAASAASLGVLPVIYQPPFYSDPRDAPSRQPGGGTVVAGRRFQIATSAVDDLPPFAPHLPALFASAAGSPPRAPGAPLRCITPARPPPTPADTAEWLESRRRRTRATSKTSTTPAGGRSRSLHPLATPSETRGARPSSSFDFVIFRAVLFPAASLGKTVRGFLGADGDEPAATAGLSLSTLNLILSPGGSRPLQALRSVAHSFVSR